LEEHSIEKLINFVPSIEPSNTVSLSDISDISDTKNVLSVGECLRLHSGNVIVQGTITSISRLYKMIKSVTLECVACGYDKEVVFQIPQHYPGKTTNQTCDNCNKSVKTLEEMNEYVNAVSIELQDSDTFSDIEKLSCILFDENTIDIQVGSKVVISGSIQIVNQKNKKSISYLYSSSIHYENKEILELSQQDIDSIKNFKK
jgi:DNA replicative helicase MCM subunit Mcm2 (Cdc46/Mcm family)